MRGARAESPTRAWLAIKPWTCANKRRNSVEARGLIFANALAREKCECTGVAGMCLKASLLLFASALRGRWRIGAYEEFLACEVVGKSRYGRGVDDRRRRLYH